MPEFKVVIADPAVKRVRAVPVKVVGDDELEYSDKHKEQYELPRIKVHPEIVKLTNPELGVVIVRIWRDRIGGERIKLAGRYEEDSSLDKMMIKVPAEFMREKLGKQEALGEILRAPSFQIRVRGDAAQRFIGLRIGDTIEGAVVGLPGIKLRISGGSDIAGFPMRPDVPGAVKRYLLLSSGLGFRPRERGERRRKLVRGNTISEDIVQVNTVIVK
ncbi:MAG: 30S ribosomal protein S6e [Thermoprotei archaeon]|nr:MAG: 30S ribosomal protein S6e [Thermoprotei archaeon]